MPKSLEDVKKALEAVDGGAELYEAVTTGISAESKRADTEKTRGIAEANKRNKENEGLRKFKKSMETLGFDHDSDELDTFVEDMTGKLKEASEKHDPKDVTKSPQYQEILKTTKKLQKQLDTQAEELKSEKENASTMKVKTQRNQMKSVLMTTLNEKVYGADYLVESLISNDKVKLDEDDEKVVIFVEGDNTIEYEDGIAKLLEARKDIVKNPQSGGGGTGGSGDGTGAGKPTDQERTKKLRSMAKFKI